MRALLVILVANTFACYNPKFGQPGFTCVVTDDPPCPDGLLCVNGRCVNHIGGGLTVDGGNNVPPPDLAGQPPPPPMPDLSQPNMGNKTGCSGYVKCIVACGASMTCGTGCDNNVTASGKMLFQTALGCGQQQCLNSGDCVVDPTGTMLTDGAGTGSCNNCLNNALASLVGTQCSPPGDPNCNPAQCRGSYGACLSDAP
jgi:hypothetical protein